MRQEWDDLYGNRRNRVKLPPKWWDCGLDYRCIIRVLLLSRKEGKALEAVRVMALIDCPECGKGGVSDKALACTHCGYPIKEFINAEKYKKTTKVLVTQGF